MKKAFLFMCIIGLSTVSLAQKSDTSQKKPIEQIRKYWFVLLVAGPDRTQDSATAAKLQEGHIANIDRLYYEGKIKVAGPFGEKGDWKGIFIFDADSKEEVEQLLQTDPAIAAGRLSCQVKPWYTAPVGSFTPGKPKKD